MPNSQYLRRNMCMVSGWNPNRGAISSGVWPCCSWCNMNKRVRARGWGSVLASLIKSCSVSWWFFGGQFRHGAIIAYLFLLVSHVLRRRVSVFIRYISHDKRPSEPEMFRRPLLMLRRKLNQPNALRAPANKRYQPLNSPQPSGAQLICALRYTRSGCGIMMVTRPSALLTPAMPCGEPLGLSG